MECWYQSLKLNEGYIKAFTRRAECFLQVPSRVPSGYLAARREVVVAAWR